MLGARAFTYGSDIFVGGTGAPTDIGLLAHEVAHVVQQGQAPLVQLSSITNAAASDPLERDAAQAADAVRQGQPAVVHEHVSEQHVQRLGISDALDYFADKAYLIPGYRMFTLLLGINPINMSRVERSAANLLRALIELLPGGYIITQALDAYQIFERVGAWIQNQLESLGLSGATIRQAINRFLDSLSWRDIFHLGDVWDRAKRIFTDPIDRILTFARNLVSGILRFVREAVLRPLARLAEGTRGWDLLKAVLGQDPITGEPVPRTAETLIGGFMKLIGQEEVWNNIKRANAIPRAWAWFQGVLSGLLGFVRQIPTLFVSALQQLELMDFIVLPRLFTKLAHVFGGFLGSFIGWAGQQVLALLQIIFEVVAPGVMPYLRRAAGALQAIFRNPVGFVGNLVRAGLQGFRQFAGNFLNHLRKSLIDWLTGTLVGAGVYIPQALELREIVKFVLSVLGLTWQAVRGKLVRLIGEPALKALETGFDLVVTLVREGPAAAWEKIRESLGNLRDMVMEQVMTFVRNQVVQAAITRLLTSLNPAGAFIQAIIATYNTVMFFVERLRQIAQVAMAFLDSMAAIASGNIGTAASRVETTMAGLLTLVISFLARIAGLGRVSDAVKNIVDRIRAPIDKALDRVADWLVTMARSLRPARGQPTTPPDARAAPAQPGAPAVGEGDQPRVVVPVALGPQTHEVIFDPHGDSIDVLIASVPFPMAQTFGDAMAKIDNWRRYIESIADPAVRALFQPTLERVTAFHGQQVTAFQGIYRRFYPRGDAPRPLPPQQHRQAGVQVTELSRAVAAELADIARVVALLPPQALQGITAADFEKFAMSEGKRVWTAAWQTKKKAIDDALAGENLGGRPVAYRGSLVTGMRGDHKGKVRWDPNDFDVDMYVVNSALYNELTDQLGAYKVRPNRADLIFPGESRYAPLRELSQRCALKVDAIGTGRPDASFVILRRVAP
jgi:hypothetical protein